MSRTFAGLRVVELAEVWAGPFGCTLLGDLGADVIKVETYPRPSVTRPLREDSRVAPGPGPAYERVNSHIHGNRNKRNIAVDARRPEGAEVLRRLIAGADLLVEGFTGGTIERLGFGWETVRALNPRLTMISIAGWGQGGPYQGYLMFGNGFDAAAGHHAIRGYPGTRPDEIVGALHSDASVPLAIVFATGAALLRREQTGAGCFIDLSQVEELQWQLPAVLAEWTLNGRVPERVGNTDPRIVPHDCYPATGGWVTIVCENDEQWGGLAGALGHPEWAGDGHPWATVIGRLSARAAIDAAIASYTRERPAGGIAEELQAAGAIAAPVLQPNEPPAAPQLHERGWFQIVDQPYLGERMMTGFLWQQQPDPIVWERRCALLGEHNHEVLAEIGYGAGEVAELEARDIIGNRYPDPE
ncbi:MAG: CoA transferase [Chloroflexi bacterium]|nr:CoA transferase [Chloroflexota bacterium]